jgi:tetratricopeptide (TPR) repeat protein
MHAGLAMGEVIVGSSGGSWNIVGETVNLASRLTDLAPPGEIFVSEPVQRALTGRAIFEGRGRHALKGFADATDVWRLADLAPADEAAPLTPFVGRALELAQVVALLENCNSSRAGGAIYVAGEPGIGKSRLIGEARAQAARRGMACHVCHALEFGAGLERDPLRRLSDSLLGLVPDASPDVRTAAVDAVMSQNVVEPRVRPFIYELAEAPLTPALRSLIDASDESSRRTGRRDALVLLAELALARCPTFIVFEDLHWAKADLVDAILALARLTVEQPLVLALTSRREKEIVFAALRSQPAGASLVTIDVGPLRAQDAETIVARIGNLPQSASSQFVARAGGNPLFLEQLLLNAVEGAGSLPPSLRGLVLARIDRLSAGDRAAIHAAAVLGDRFDPAALQALLDNPRYSWTGLLQAGLLRVDATELVFAHALIREAVQRSLLVEAQRLLHSRAAAWFAERDPLLWALHLERAESPLAAEACRVAAEDRLKRYRPAEALPLVDRGLTLTTDADGRAALLVLKGDALFDAGQMREALGAYQAALAADGSARNRCLALLGSAQARRVLDELVPALADVAAAQDLAEAGGWIDVQARCRYTRGNIYYPMGRVEDCRIEHLASLELANQSDNTEGKARALGGLADAEFASGHMLACTQYAQQCVEESRRIGLGRVEVANQPMWAFGLLHMFRPRETLAIARDSVAVAAAVGQRRAELVAQLAMLHALLELCEFEEGRVHVNKSLEIVHHLEAPRFEAHCLAILAEFEWEMGEYTKARDLVTKALEVARTTGMTYYGPSILGLSAKYADTEEARSSFMSEAEVALGGHVLAFNQFGVRNFLIDVGWQRSDPGYIEEQCKGLETAVDQHQWPWVEFTVRRGRVLAAALSGRPSPVFAAEARALIDWAARVGARRRVPTLEVALKLLSAGAALEMVTRGSD